MTIEQRLEQLEKRNKRLTVALSMTVVAMCAVVTMAATELKDSEDDRQVVSARQPTAFVGSVKLGQVVGRDAARIADEVIAHLAALPGADVEVSLEISIRAPQGVPENVVRAVSENANVLKFNHASFEQE